MMSGLGMVSIMGNWCHQRGGMGLRDTQPGCTRRDSGQVQTMVKLLSSDNGGCKVWQSVSEFNLVKAFLLSSKFSA